MIKHGETCLTEYCSIDTILPSTGQLRVFVLFIVRQLLSFSRNARYVTVSLTSTREE